MPRPSNVSVTSDAWDAAVFAERQRLGYEHTRVRGYRDRCVETCAACERERRRHGPTPMPPVDIGCGPDCPVCRGGIEAANAANRPWTREYIAAPTASVRARFEPQLQQVPRRDPYEERVASYTANLNRMYQGVYNAGAVNQAARRQNGHNWTWIMDEGGTPQFKVWVGGDWGDFIKFWGHVGEVHEARAYMKPVDESRYMSTTQLAKKFNQKLGKKKKADFATNWTEQMAAAREYYASPPMQVIINEPANFTPEMRVRLLEPSGPDTWRVHSVSSDRGVINMVPTIGEPT